MSNAFKYTPRGGKIVVRVQLDNECPNLRAAVNNKSSGYLDFATGRLSSTTHSNAMLQIEVIDTGCGIPAVSVRLLLNVYIYFHGNLFCRRNCLSY